MINVTQCYPVDTQFESFPPAANATLTGAISKCDNGKVVVGVSVYQFDKEVEVTCKYLARSLIGILERSSNQPGQLQYLCGTAKKVEDTVNTASSSVQSSSKSVGLSWLTTPNNSKQKGNQSNEDQSDDEEPKTYAYLKEYYYFSSFGLMLLYLLRGDCFFVLSDFNETRVFFQCISRTISYDPHKDVELSRPKVSCLALILPVDVINNKSMASMVIFMFKRQNVLIANTHRLNCYALPQQKSRVFHTDKICVLVLFVNSISVNKCLMYTRFQLLPAHLYSTSVRGIYPVGALCSRLLLEIFPVGLYQVQDCHIAALEEGKQVS